ncbi:carboxylating nicotinate-nucleotide diphosphorylase [Mesorhizobium loti]|uniref:Probable nicotinate-nucleotide pyrophosphorylase [carboxylating] n=1 Tax=Rhizobium loti TaxID=381 RepID=A0A1A5PUE4_RHILI|nr:carboxylating nicotinate-nucleotide diphosphorylase [Mesorhizobium loti]OBP79990.1 nicotinate-nucleotide diphosphorylase (carboxylating) [Mesorhizobium loti]OBQ59050.1 nicotinate-nucleotide diphosphorylase (carboxylating) [Mesorhizobium loti]QKC73361.1 carboxylating nicotinate-nucleotide diphosphorylase [Mesorhizobium loti]
MTSLAPLPQIIMEPIVRNALLEDLGRAGDITSDAIIPADCKATLSLNARQAGVVAGLDLVMFAFLLVNPGISIQLRCPEGGKISTGQTIAIVNGPARSLLTAERTALNFLCKLSGIATATATLVNAVRGHNAKIVCTRKTTPGLRVLEKYAVRAGGGANHRFALDDAVLIKDNHIAIAGDIRTAIERARSAIGHMVKIEVEVDRLDQLEIALAAGVDAVLLDNMSVEDLAQAVAMVGGRAITEASGRVTRASAAAIAATGVDLISVGWLTHSAPILDIGLDMPADRNCNRHLN